VGRRERLMTSAPGGPTREPIGVEKLVELYDDYPRVLRSLEATLDRAEKAEADVRTTEDERDNLHDELERERAARKSDNRKAIHEAEAATKWATEEKLAADKAREDKIRGELQPRIDELSAKLKETTADRDLLRKDLDTMRVQLHSWIEGMERLRKDRQEAEDREKKAAEDRAALMQKTKGFDEQILEGLRLAVKPPHREESTATATARTVDEAK
jgi:chromosome segregation ATPase